MIKEDTGHQPLSATGTGAHKSALRNISIIFPSSFLIIVSSCYHGQKQSTTDPILLKINTRYWA